MPVYILSVYQTKFGELWNSSLEDLIDQTIDNIFKNSPCHKSQINTLFLSNMLGQSTDNQGHLASYASQKIGNIPAYKVESACASAGAAINLAYNYLNSGVSKTALVIGVEKMTDIASSSISNYLVQAGSQKKEGRYGVTFPALYALITRAYKQKYGLTRDQLSSVAVKNHFHGSLNEKAHFRNKITLEMVNNSPLVADPLRLLDCSPITDGAAAAILTTDKSLVKKITNPKITLLTSTIATDTLALQDRSSFTSLKSAKLASQKAYKLTKLSPSDIDFLELHDCFTINEIISLEDLGFYPPGAGKYAAQKGQTYLNGPLPVNTSGGLKACGHPVGASGLKQLIEIYLQLKGLAGLRQLKNPKIGLTHNIGGSGATCVINILSNKN